LVLFTGFYRDAGQQNKKREQVLLQLLITDLSPHKRNYKCRCLEPRTFSLCNTVGGSALPTLYYGNKLCILTKH